MGHFMVSCYLLVSFPVFFRSGVFFSCVIFFGPGLGGPMSSGPRFIEPPEPPVSTPLPATRPIVKILRPQLVLAVVCRFTIYSMSTTCRPTLMTSLADGCCHSRSSRQDEQMAVTGEGRAFRFVACTSICGCHRVYRGPHDSSTGWAKKRGHRV